MAAVSASAVDAMITENWTHSVRNVRQTDRGVRVQQIHAVKLQCHGKESVFVSITREV